MVDTKPNHSTSAFTNRRTGAFWVNYSSVNRHIFNITSPGHHLLLFIGGMAAAADWSNSGGQEVEAVVFEVLVHQRQHDLEMSETMIRSVYESDQ